LIRSLAARARSSGGTPWNGAYKVMTVRLHTTTGDPCTSAANADDVLDAGACVAHVTLHRPSRASISNHRQRRTQCMGQHPTKGNGRPPLKHTRARMRRGDPAVMDDGLFMLAMFNQETVGHERKITQIG
jgi:hypothetical protein